MTVGVFYLIQAVPELDENRIKLGWTQSIDQRMKTHRVMAPTAHVLGTWPCHETWERAAIEAITGGRAIPLTREMFNATDVQSVASAASEFFSIDRSEPRPQPKSPVPMDWAFWALLAVADNRWHHGYGVLQGIRGFCDQRIPTGVLYPLLERLRQSGLMDMDREEGHAIYRITADGYAALKARIQLYRCALEAADSVMAPPRPADAHADRADG